ncbi:GerAB/ArcD/ProY family transporter [Alicyclobacillus shizuokensis]|uniref:GerAB/ArcD/ProY family transporter n=1 Tax=Alicyclobacillus shizuokensis TaxID=392014 RepID=UPI00082D8FAA|nr:GerAB/ArcD/ProY family transporter [Alicyclobacillus shizuokensis]MCL6625516.1 GerAB/ArcD/ProY family transporter [Alicyclobacillus shizuokensis]
MMRGRNAQTYGILVFIPLLGPATFDWFPDWLEGAGTNVWWLLMAWWLLAVVLGRLTVAVMAINRDHGPPQLHTASMLETMLGRWGGRLANFLWAFVLCLYGARVLQSGIELIHYDVLPYTPTSVLIVLGLLIPLQLLVGGVDALLRYCAVLFWPALLLGLAMSMLCFRRADFANLFPLANPMQAGQWLGALPHVLQLLPGWSLVMLYTPLFQAWLSPGTAFRAYLFGGGGVLLLMALDFCMVLANFGAFEGAALQWPVIEAMRMQLGIRLDVINLIPILIAVSGLLNLCVFGAYMLIRPYIRMPSVARGCLVLGTCGSLAWIADVYVGTSKLYEASSIGFGCVLVVALSVWLTVRHERSGAGSLVRR